MIEAYITLVSKTVYNGNYTPKYGTIFTTAHDIGTFHIKKVKSVKHLIKISSFFIKLRKKIQFQIGLKHIAFSQNKWIVIPA